MSSDDTTEYRFQVAMTCEGCSGAVTRVLNKHLGPERMRRVTCDLAAQTVTVELQGAGRDLSQEDVLQLVQKAGKETKAL